MKKLAFALCLALGGCASMPPVHMPTFKHHIRHTAAPVAPPVVAPAAIPSPVPAPAPVEAPKPAKRKRWLDYLRSFKKDKGNG